MVCGIWKDQEVCYAYKDKRGTYTFECVMQLQELCHLHF